MSDAARTPSQPWREASRRLHEAGDDTDDGLVPTHARRPGDSLDDVEEASSDRLSGSNRSHPSQPTPSQPDLRAALALIHRPVSNPMYPSPICEDDGQEWPCKTGVVLRLASQPAPAAVRKTTDAEFEEQVRLAVEEDRTPW